ncbi:MAG: DNA internalization-related competence protein ComEC/Rec2 [Lachnospiraceae bacterium]|nr:DNA internalization-related competence protein ComEC/Rec2 [Lachnospiraceae bacterium]
MTRRPLCLAALIVCLAVFVSLRLFPPETASFSAFEGDTAVMTGTAVSVSHKTAWDGQEILRISLKDLTVESPEGLSEILPPDAMILCETDARSSAFIPAGGRIRVRGKIREFAPATNPGAFDARLYYQCQGYSLRLKGADVLAASEGSTDPLGRGLTGFRDFLSAVLDRICVSERDASLLKALLLGEKGSLDAETKDLYQGAGIIAILTISGLHISLIGTAFFQMLRRLRLPLFASALLTLALILLYGKMTGMGSSALRAIIMFAMQLGARLLGRTYDLLTAVSAAGILLLLEQPLYLTQSGFLFSFGAVLAAGIILPVMPGQDLPRPLPALFQGMAIPLACLPIYASSYYTFPVYSMILNLIISPLLTVVMFTSIGAMAMGASAFTLGSPLLFSLSRALSWPAHLILWFYELLCRAVRAMPGYTLITGAPSSLQILLYLMILVFFALSTEKKPEKTDPRVWNSARMALLFLGVCMLCLRPSRGLTLTFLDVGQGDGIYIEADGTRILVDGGSSSESALYDYTLEPFLQYKGVRTLDYVILSHDDIDHMSGMISLLEKSPENGIRIRNLLVPDVSPSMQESENFRALTAAAEKSHIPVTGICRGDVIRGGKLRLTCLHPMRDAFYPEANFYSTTLLLEYGSFRALLTGDLEEQGEADFLDYVRDHTFLTEGGKRACPLTVLKCGHHGSANATGQELLDAFPPAYGIISCGRRNRYGHPSPEVMERLKEAGVTVLDTRTGGALTFRTDGKKLRIETYLKP